MSEHLVSSHGSRVVPLNRLSAWSLRNRQSGVTLTELMIALAVTAVLAGMAAPTFGAVIRNSRVTASTNELLATLHLARSEAVKRGRRVTVCTSPDQSSCATGVQWHNGWLVFEDRNGNALREADEPLIYAAPPRAGGMRITGGGPMANYASYVPTGSTRLINGGLQFDTLTVCLDGSGRRIVINVAGRARVTDRIAC